MATGDKNSAQPCIRQRCIDIEHAGGEHILLSAAPSKMDACLERWMYPRRDEYRPQGWYDVVAVIFQPSRLSLLAEGWMSSTGESTTETPSVTTHAESPLTSVRTSTVDDLHSFMSDCWTGTPSSFHPFTSWSRFSQCSLQGGHPLAQNYRTRRTEAVLQDRLRDCSM